MKGVHTQNRNFTSVFGDRTSFRAKGLPRISKSQFYLSFWRSNFISCERVAAAHSEWQFYVSFWRSNLISCERISAEVVKSQFYVSFWRSSLVSCERVAFRAVSLALPRAFKREIEKKERARGQQSKRARGQESKRARENVKMWRWEDVKMRYDEMWRWEDVKIWGCEDVKMFDRPPLLDEPFAQTLSGKIADKSLLQPWCSHSNTAKKPTVLSTQPRLQATLTQPLQCDLQRLSCEAQKNYAQRRQKSGAFRARLPLKSEIWRCENEAFVRDLPEKVKVQDKAEDVKTKLSCETCLKVEDVKNEAFVRDLPEKVKVEDVKTKLSCETCLKKWEWKMWKRSFRARLAWKSESARCESEAFVRDLPEKVKVEDVKTKLSCETCLKKWVWKMWKRSFRARLAWKSESGRCENEAFVRDLPEKVKVQDVKAKLSCETSLTEWKWKMWKRSFRARLAWKSESGRCENEAFVRDLPEKVSVEDVKTKLSCETCLKKWKWKMWKRSFRARLAWKSESARCENEAFVRDFPDRVKVEDVKTKLSCETCLKKWKCKMWKRSFRARLSSKSESGRCENEAFVRDFHIGIVFLW